MMFHPTLLFAVATTNMVKIIIMIIIIIFSKLNKYNETFLNSGQYKFTFGSNFNKLSKLFRYWQLMSSSHKTWYLLMWPSIRNSARLKLVRKFSSSRLPPPPTPIIIELPQIYTISARYVIMVMVMVMLNARLSNTISLPCYLCLLLQPCSCCANWLFPLVLHLTYPFSWGLLCISSTEIGLNVSKLYLAFFLINEQ